MNQPVQYQYVFPNAVVKTLHLPEFAPDPAPIVRVWLFAQNPEQGFPAGSYGDVAVAVDPGSRYSTSAGFPSDQFEEPYYLKTIGLMETYPGMPRGQKLDHPNPVLYSKSAGDCIVFAPEIRGVPNLLLYMGIVWLQEADIPNQAGTRLFSVTLDTDLNMSADICMRSIIPAGGMAGSKARVRISSQASYSVVQHASIGVRKGATANMVMPVELTFNTMPGFLLAPFSRCWSDWATLTKGAGDDLLVNFDLFNGGQNNRWGYKNTDSAGGYYSSAPSFNFANMAGSPIFQCGRTYIVDRVEVR